MTEEMSGPDRDDQRLLEGCLAGEAPAWRRFAQRFGSALLRAASARLGAVLPGASSGEAEDVVQRVLARRAGPGRGSLAGFEGRSRLGTWLVALVLREASDYARGELRARSRIRRGERPAAEVPSPLSDLVRKEEAERLAGALEGLSGRERLLLRMIYWEGLSYRAAAGILGVAEASISPLLGRARESLKKRLVRTDPLPGGVSFLEDR